MSRKGRLDSRSRLMHASRLIGSNCRFPTQSGHSTLRVILGRTAASLGAAGAAGLPVGAGSRSPGRLRARQRLPVPRLDRGGLIALHCEMVQSVANPCAEAGTLRSRTPWRSTRVSASSTRRDLVQFELRARRAGATSAMVRVTRLDPFQRGRVSSVISIRQETRLRTVLAALSRRSRETRWARRPR